MRKEIRFAGEGGQGIILSGIILAEAAGVHENFYTTQTQSYGPESRGGASKSEVIISDSPILYPEVRIPDILVCLNQISYDVYSKNVKDSTIILVDDWYLHRYDERAIALPFATTARKELKRLLFTNIVMLGALSSITGIVKLESLKKSIKGRVPPHTVEQNLKALDLGFNLGEKWKERRDG